MEAIPQCLACGTCCFSQLDSYVRVMGDDYTRLGDQAARLTVFIGHRCYMRMTEGHCGALTIDASGRFACSVYEQRPELCRGLERGSPACQAELAQKRERPRTALLALHRKRPSSVV